MQNIKYTIGKNLKKIRKDRHLTLQQLSDITGVSKSMLGEIERSVTNPTVTVLWKIANGLKIPFSTLIKEKKSPISIVHNEDIKPTIEGDRYIVSSIFNFDEDKKFEVYFKEFEPGGKLESEGHNKGVEEYILVSAGKLSLKINDRIYELHEGDAINFFADCPHTYYNDGNAIVKAFMIIYYTH